MGIMDGIKVVEVASWTYVPVAGAVLAEWGADVIKIEHPESGDPQRGLAASGLVPTGPGGVAHMMELPNRGKRSVGLDLGTAEGRKILLELSATADVFLTNFRPQARRKLAIDVEDIRAVNPSIIYVRGSGQGQRGPDAEMGGYDGSTFWGRGGPSDIISDPDDGYPIAQPGPAFGDVIGGLTIAGGISAALFHRERTGEAVIVDNSLLATAMWATGASSLAAGLFGVDRLPRRDRTETPNPIVGTYRTADGRFISLVMLESDRYFGDLVTLLGRPGGQLGGLCRRAGRALRPEDLGGVEADTGQGERGLGPRADPERVARRPPGAGQRLYPRRGGEIGHRLPHGALTAAVRRAATRSHQGAGPRRAHR